MASPQVSLPRSANGSDIPLGPSTTAKAAPTISSSIAGSTTLTFNSATTFLRIYAIDKDVYFKWGATTVDATNFDEVIPANQIVDLVIPTQQTTGVLYATCRFIERAATATIIIIEK